MTRYVNLILGTLVVLVLFFTSSLDGGFWWSDAPRHALNGVFLKDALFDFVVNDPRAYAIDYYKHFPALTILFYPLLFPAVESLFFTVFGVNVWVPTLTVLTFYAVALLFAYKIFALYFDANKAMLLAAIFALLPEIAEWGRQIMLEIPAYALMLVSVYYYLSYTRNKKQAYLLWSVAFLLAAVYTKLSVCFMFVVFAFHILWSEGVKAFYNKYNWAAFAIATVFIMPALALSVKFGQANLQSVSGISDAAVQRGAVEYWLWYLQALPAQMTWGGLVVVIIGAGIGVLCYGTSFKESTKSSLVFYLLWFIIGYMFYTMIDLKEARHSVFLLFPLVLLIGVVLNRITSKKVSYLVASVIITYLLHQAVYIRPAPDVDGYNEAAKYVDTNTSKDERILFHGYRDGSFIFNFRMETDRNQRKAILRSDKLLFSLAIRRSLGLEEKLLSKQDLVQIFYDYGITYVVFEPLFWDDLENSKLLKQVLESPQFEKVKTIAITSNRNVKEQELIIFKNLATVSVKPVLPSLELKIIDEKI